MNSILTYHYNSNTIELQLLIHSLHWVPIWSQRDHINNRIVPVYMSNSSTIESIGYQFPKETILIGVLSVGQPTRVDHIEKGNKLVEYIYIII